MLESLSIIGYLIVENEQLMQGWWVFSQPEENTLTGSAMLRPLHTEEFTVTATAATEGAFNYPPFLSAMILFRSLGQRLVVMFNCVSCLLPQTPKLLWLQTAIPDAKFSNLLLRTILSLLAWYILLTKRALDTHSVFEALSRTVHSEFFFYVW